MVSLYKVGRYVVLSILSIFWICIFLLKAKWLFNLFLDVFFFFFNILLICPVVEVCTGLFFLFQILPKEFWLALSWTNSDPSCPLSKEFLPNLPIPKEILPNLTHYQSKEYCLIPHPLQKKLWLILPPPQGILNNPTHSQNNYKRSCPLNH